MAVFGDEEVILLEDVKIGGEVDDTKFIVAEKLELEVVPDCARGGHWRHHFLKKVIGDDAVETTKDDAVHPQPINLFEKRSIGGDVVRQGIFVENHKKQAEPARVVSRGEVESHRHQRFDVEDNNGLGMECGKGIVIQCWKSRDSVAAIQWYGAGCWRSTSDANRELGEERHELGRQWCLDRGHW